MTKKKKTNSRSATCSATKRPKPSPPSSMAPAFAKVSSILRTPTFFEFVKRTTAFELHPWQRDYLVPILEGLAREKGQRILIHAPPQYGKSILVSKRFPAWALGINPKLRIVLAGYNQTHAADFCEVVRDIMQGPD